MIHFHSTFFLRGACCVALTSLAFSARASAQESKPDVAPGTPVVNPEAQQTPAAAKEKPKYLRYMRAGANGAQARNLGDANGVSVAKLSAGTLVAVYQESGDWLECEVPGGFEIWVYGQYVKASSEAGVLEITGSEVRARPLASSGPESYPLQPNLSKGDHVRLISRNDSGKPLAEDWIKVYSPPGVRGFVAKADCEPLASGSDGASAWASAVVEARKRTPATVLPKTVPASTDVLGTAKTAIAGDLTPQQALEELKLADAALARERVAEKPEFTAVREQYERVLASVKDGATHDMAQRGLHEIDALSQAHALKAEIEADKARTVSEAEERQRQIDNIKNNNDPFKDRFVSRGWVEKRNVPGQQPTFILRWGGDQVSEIVCLDGRYDLAAFNGYEIGVKGDEKRAFTPGSISRVAVPRLINATRIEVLSGRQAAR